MLNYYIPCFITNFNLNTTLLKLWYEKKEMFYDDFQIAGVFGNFPNCTWDGNRELYGRFFAKEEQQNISEIFETYDVPIQLTMTNKELEERDLYDRFGNYILENMDNGKNQVICASEILEKHIRENFPNYKIIKSIAASKDVYYDDTEKYHLSVLRRSKNNDFDLLKSIKNKSKIKILANDDCPTYCNRQYEHYSAINKSRLYKQLENPNDILCKCPVSLHDSFNPKNPLVLTRNDIKNIYEPMGFEHYKIAGRGKGNRLVWWYSHYMVKPEWQPDFISIMTQAYARDVLLLQNTR